MHTVPDSNLRTTLLLKKTITWSATSREKKLGNIVGHYSDDTQMTIAIAKLIMGNFDWTQKTVLSSFLDTFKADPRKTYSPHMYNSLIGSSSVEDLASKISCDSTRNGAAMRSAPIGLVKSVDEVKRLARIQAESTHNTFEGIVTSQAVALSVNYFLHQNGRKAGLQDYLYAQTGEFFRADYKDRVPCDAIETLDASISIVMRSSTLSDVLINSVSLGGDTDTVSIISCAIAYFSSEMVNDLPEFLFNDIENGEFGKEYLIKLDCSLEDKFMDKKQNQ